MQHDNGRRSLRRGADHAVFEIGGADAKEAGGGETLHDISFPNVMQMPQPSCGSSGVRRDDSWRRPCLLLLPSPIAQLEPLNLSGRGFR